MAVTAKSKGQDENVVLTHLFLRLVTKLSMVISGIRMKSPSPTVVWSAISAAGNHPSQASTSTTAQLSLKYAQSGLPWSRSHLDWSRGSFLGGLCRRPLTGSGEPHTAAASTGVTQHP